MFKKNTPFEEYNIDKNLSFEENFKNYANFCTKERINYYFDNQDKCNINEKLKKYVYDCIKIIQKHYYKDTEVYIIEREFFKIINQALYGKLFQTTIGSSFIYDYKFNLKEMLSNLSVKRLDFYEHYSIENFCTETNNNIGYVFAAVMFMNDNYYYMILNTLRHNLDVLNRKAVI